MWRAMAELTDCHRTPMHGMLTACSLLMDTGLGAEQGELAHIIRESGAILLQVMYASTKNPAFHRYQY